MFSGIAFRGVRREQFQPQAFGHGKAFGFVPAGTVEEEQQSLVGPALEYFKQETRHGVASVLHLGERLASPSPSRGAIAAESIQ